jgi:GT2 family glycosyltransferase
MKGDFNHFPFVSIIIVTCNHRNFLEPCLKSVLNSDYPNYEVIVVDNGSIDGSVELVEHMTRDTAKLRLIKSSTNLGHSLGVDIGVERAQGEYIAKLDDDTIVDPNWLKELMNVLTVDPNIGVSQSGSYYYEGAKLKPQPAYAADLDYLGQIHFRHIESVQEVFHPTIYACAMKKNLFKKVGGLYPEYIIYYDEVDLGWKLRLLGYRCVAVPSSAVRHKGPPKGVNPIFEFHSIKNHLLTLMINYSLANLVRYLPPILSLRIAEGLLGLAKRQDPKTMLYVIKALLWNLVNFRRTYHRRKIVNCRLRLVSDDQIMKNMIKPRIYLTHGPK